MSSAVKRNDRMFLSQFFEEVFRPPLLQTHPHAVNEEQGKTVSCDFAVKLDSVDVKLGHDGLLRLFMVDQGCDSYCQESFRFHRA